MEIIDCMTKVRWLYSDRGNILPGYILVFKDDEETVNAYREYNLLFVGRMKYGRLMYIRRTCSDDSRCSSLSKVLPQMFDELHANITVDEFFKMKRFVEYSNEEVWLKTEDSEDDMIRCIR